MSTYTKGPWVARRDPANSRRWRIHAEDNDKSAVGGTAFWLTTDSAVEEASNAKLMAAAPELLEALEEAIEWNLIDGDVPPNIVNKIEAAIATAKGES